MADERQISLCQALYPEGIKHVQQSEWWSMIEAVRELKTTKRESRPDDDLLKRCREVLGAILDNDGGEKVSAFTQLAYIVLEKTVFPSSPNCGNI